VSRRRPENESDPFKFCTECFFKAIWRRNGERLGGNSGFTKLMALVVLENQWLVSKKVDVNLYVSGCSYNI